MRLYDLSEQYNDLIDLMELDEDNEALQSMLDGIDGAFDDKVESIIKLMKSKEYERDAVDAEKKRLSERAGKIGRDINWLKDYVQTQMLMTGKTKVKSALFNISLAKNPPSIVILDESSIPDDYYNVKTTRSLDKRWILELLKNEKHIPGVKVEQKQSLRVK